MYSFEFADIKRYIKR